MRHDSQPEYAKGDGKNGNHKITELLMSFISFIAHYYLGDRVPKKNLKILLFF